jgi:hypothetical protein
MLNYQTQTRPTIPTGPRRQRDQTVTYLNINSGWLFTGPL